MVETLDRRVPSGEGGVTLPSSFSGVSALARAFQDAGIRTKQAGCRHGQFESTLLKR
jgi:hypothetical protein